MKLSIGGVMKKAVSGLTGKWLTVLLSLAATLCAFFLVMVVSEAVEYSAALTLDYVADEKTREAMLSNLYTVITVMSAAATLLVAVPISVGFKRVILLSVRDENPSFADLFWCYSLRRLIRTAGLKFTVAIKLFLWTALFIIPSYLSYHIINGFAAEWIAVYVKYLLIGIGVCVFAVKLVSYSAVDFIFIQNEEMKSREIIKKSTSNFGLHGEAFGKTSLLYLALAPIILTCLLIFPLFYVIPFVFACVAVNTDTIINP